MGVHFEEIAMEEFRGQLNALLRTTVKNPSIDLKWLIPEKILDVFYQNFCEFVLERFSWWES